MSLILPLEIAQDDLECAIHLKVRLVDGTLNVRLLRVSDSTIRIGVARGGGGGVGWHVARASTCHVETRVKFPN